MKLEYGSNGTTRVSPFVLECWQDLKELSLDFSIDGYKEHNDFFRTGSRWEEVVSNIHWYRERLRGPKFSITIHGVVNIYNVFNLVELDDWLTTEFPGIYLSKDILIQPGWLDIRSLPEYSKKELSRFYARAARNVHYPRFRRQPYGWIAQRLQDRDNPPFEDFLSQNQRLNELRQSRESELHPRLRALIAAKGKRFWPRFCGGVRSVYDGL